MSRKRKKTEKGKMRKEKKKIDKKKERGVVDTTNLGLIQKTSPNNSQWANNQKGGTIGTSTLTIFNLSDLSVV